MCHVVLLLAVCATMCLAQTSGCAQKHQVVRGNTCATIAQRYGLTLSTLYSVNTNIGLNEKKCSGLPIGTSMCVRAGGPGTVSGLPIVRGSKATLTVFNDKYVQCFTPAQPKKIGLGVAVNPLMLGITKADWKAKYVNADPSKIPWCGKTIELSFKGRTQRATIVDTCQPCSTAEGYGEAPACDYTDDIDFWANGRINGETLLRRWDGDDFYQGKVNWRIL